MVESSPKALQQFTTFKFILAVKTLNFRVRFFSALPIYSTLKYSFITTSKIFNLLCMKVLHTYAIIFSAYVIFHFPILYNNSMSFHSWRTNSSFLFIYIYKHSQNMLCSSTHSEENHKEVTYCLSYLWKPIRD